MDETDKTEDIRMILLTEAAKAAAEELGAELTVPADAPGMSPRARRRILRTIRRAQRRPLPVRIMRAACFMLAAVICLGGGIVMSVEALREKFFDFTFNSNALGSKVTFKLNDEPHTSYAGKFVTLNYIPNDFECVKSKAMTYTEILYFENNDLWFCFSILSGGTTILDTENAKYEETEVNGYEAIYLEKDTRNSLTWTDGELPYNIYGNISKDTMLKIAENIAVAEQ